MNSSSLSTGYLQRFGGIGRLYGMPALERLATAHFVIIGIGGVGSWAAEALARTGIGRLTLVDMDEVCISNNNRQIHTLTSTIGRAKTLVMKERLQEINPELQIHIVDDFMEPENVAQLLGKQHDIVIDCVDAAYAKAAIISYCKSNKISVITVGSSGGKADPQKITYSDLTKTTTDPLLARTRNNLRRNYNFTRMAKRNFGIEAIYSTEQLKYATPEGGISENKAVFVANMKMDCEGGLGAVSMVTASFAFLACSRALERFLAKPPRANPA